MRVFSLVCFGLRTGADTCELRYLSSQYLAMPSKTILRNWQSNNRCSSQGETVSGQFLDFLDFHRLPKTIKDTKSIIKLKKVIIKVETAPINSLFLNKSPLSCQHFPGILILTTLRPCIQHSKVRVRFYRINPSRLLNMVNVAKETIKPNFT